MAAAWPHVLGIFSGHCFHFFTKVWPALGGKAWLSTPKWFEKILGGPPRSNVEGMSFRKNDIKKTTTKRKLMNGGAKARKLGSS